MFANVRNAFESIPGNRFSKTVSALLSYIDFLCSRESLIFRKTFSAAKTGNSRAVTSPENVADAPKPSYCACKVLFDHQRPVCRCIVVQKKRNVSVPRFPMFLFHCTPEATWYFDVHFFLYSTPFRSWRDLERQRKFPT